MKIHEDNIFTSKCSRQLELFQQLTYFYLELGLVVYWVSTKAVMIKQDDERRIKKRFIEKR
jgi:hypothetical protein